MIPDVAPIQGPDCTADAITRVLNSGYSAGLSDSYVPGFSGVAFLATTCTNGCLCRDFREVSVRIEVAVEEMGYSIVHVDAAKLGQDEAWEILRGSVDRGVPAVGFNVGGDFEDVPLVGYDLAADQVFAMGTDGSSEPKPASLSAWRAEPLYGYVIEGKKDGEVDLRARERERLVQVAFASDRPLIEGG